MSIINNKDATPLFPRLAQSYALQASFNIEDARQSVEEAVKIDPENALAWARLSELQLSFGNLDKAFVSAKMAAARNPNIARTQSVLGFAYLTQIKIKDSQQAFEKESI